MSNNRLPFQYAIRARQFESLPPEEKSQAVEQRDRDLEDFLGRLGAGTGGVDEVWIHTDEPVDPAIELWYDPDATPTGGGAAGTDEVWVLPTEPVDPDIELWYDPDATSTGPTWHPLVVKATEPTAADYGESSIPFDAVWIQKP